MTEPTISCPNCHTEIKLTESLAAPLVEAMRKKYETALTEKEAQIAKREEGIRDQQLSLAREKATIDLQVQAKVAAEREQVAAEETKKAKALAAAELNQRNSELVELQAVLKERDSKLAAAQKVQADLLKKQRELDDEKREIELTIQKKVGESLAAEREKAKQEVEATLKLKVLEKEETISSMQRQIEELKRRAEQGSQQLQGEVLELELEALLRTRFPGDIIEPVPKGEFGGDVLHRVIGPMNRDCGAILWESKRTKHWSDGWLAKLREDQRTAKAEIALLISSAMPKGVTAFDLVDGVWVAEPQYVLPVAIALRHSLVEVAAVRQAGHGQQSKMELVYQYLTGPRFRHRVAAIVEKFSDMQSDLDKERKTMTRLWAKREAQIRGVIESTVGMYGDLQGIAGQSLPEIEGLDLVLLNAPDPSNVGEGK